MIICDSDGIGCGVVEESSNSFDIEGDGRDKDEHFVTVTATTNTFQHSCINVTWSVVPHGDRVHRTSTIDGTFVAFVVPSSCCGEEPKHPGETHNEEENEGSDQVLMVYNLLA